MLVLSRHRSEKILVDIPPSDKHRQIVVMVTETRSDKSRIGFHCESEDVTINRWEIAAAKGFPLPSLPGNWGSR